MAGSPGYSQVSHEELVAQVIKIGDELKQLQLDNATFNAQVVDLRAKGAAGGGGGNGNNGNKSALRDFKKLYPDKYEPKKDCFTTWAEDFIRWIRAESDDLATALERAAARTQTIPMPNDHHAADVRFAWLHLKRLMGDSESKNIVREFKP